jgi:Uma2 family endonuclease
MKVRLKKGNIREPDILYMKEENALRRHEDYWDGADLVMEIVSPDPKDRARDLKDKVREYAQAKIPEYWIVDPEEQMIRVLTLEGKKYKVHGEFRRGEQATSVLLPGFAVSVEAVFAQATAEKSE